MELYEYIPIDENSLAKNSSVIRKALKDYQESEWLFYMNMTIKQARDMLISEINYSNRSNLKSCRGFGYKIRPGDICYIDFGKAYQLEIGYQHFGLCLNVFNAKAFVIPMTSNEESWDQAYDKNINPDGLTHLMRLGKIKGLYKYSVLFLNDGKYINTARVIDIKGHISPKGKLFKRIYRRFMATLQPDY